ncbi:MAG: hypothetical protein ABIO81_00135 [Ginsengibacter sp.]
MLNETPNNDFHWKLKLEDLESLQDDPFNKEASWGKLHNRLQNKSSYKKVMWYWAAAACLLLATLTQWLLSNKKENALIKNDLRQQQIQSPLSPSMPANKDSFTVIPLIPAKKKSPVNPAENDNKIITTIDHKILTFQNVAIKKDEEQSLEPGIINNIITPADPQVNIVAIIPEKKKLRIVHINELGDPVKEFPALAHKTEKHSFQLNLANQEVYINPSVNSGSTGFTILTIKNSPN